MIVTDEGQDLNGKISGSILPYAVCSIWTPNEKEIKIIEMSDKSFIDKAKDTMGDVIDKAKDTIGDVTEKAADTMENDKISKTK